MVKLIEEVSTPADESWSSSLKLIGNCAMFAAWRDLGMKRGRVGFSHAPEAEPANTA